MFHDAEQHADTVRVYGAGSRTNRKAETLALRDQLPDVKRNGFGFILDELLEVLPDDEAADLEDLLRDPTISVSRLAVACRKEYGDKHRCPSESAIYNWRKRYVDP